MPRSSASITMPDDFDAVAAGRRALATETQGLASLTAALDGALGQSFAAAVALIRKAKGRVIMSGMGKSGHVARKIAATLASTGTPAYFVHPSEASHGDLGMITTDDVVVMLSNSGESLELKDVLAYTRRFAVPLIAITSKPESALGQAADVILCLPKAEEACPNGLAPTTSTTMQLALGDALAVTLLAAKGFGPGDFRNFHPGGKLGAALVHVRDVMHKGAAIPLAAEATPMSQALVIMTEKSLGCLGVTDAAGALAGVITDGDLRRHMSPDLLTQTAGAIMTRNPKTVEPGLLASEALEIINSSKITSLFVVDQEKPVGIVHVHDLLRLGVR